MGLFDFLRRNLLTKRSRLKTKIRLLLNRMKQMTVLQGGMRLMKNLIVYILISQILAIMERLSSIC